MKVIKRDGRKKVNFDVNKILDAIISANYSLDEEKRISDAKIQKVIEYVISKIGEREEIGVEEIQDLVEQGLQNKNCYDVAKAYIIYRNDAERERFRHSQLHKEIKEKIEASKIENQNANVDEASFGGRKGEADSILFKNMALDDYISPKFSKNHINNRVYVHDLDNYIVGMHNCLSCPVDHLLQNGFQTRQAFVRPAGSVNTAMQLVAVLFQLQSLQQFGGVSATHLDWSMVPYVRKSFMKHYIVAALKSNGEFEKLDLPALMFEDYEDEAGLWHNKLDDWIEENKAKYLEEFNLKPEDFRFDNKELNPNLRQSAVYDTILETRQAVEGLFHNLNTLQSRSGNQLPFSSINYGTCTLEEGRIVIRAILETSLKGVGRGATSIFPCQIFQYKKGVNDKPGTPNYDLYKLALRSTSKRLYPNYANCDWSNQTKWVEYDRKVKQNVLDSLSPEETKKLISLIEKNPTLGKQLGLKIKEE